MTERPSTIAETADQLTPEWLTAALRSSGVLASGEVTAVDAKPLGTGQMCDSARLTLTYSGGEGPETMVAKLPASDETSRTTAINLGSYVKEVRFYTDLADGLSVRTPGVHYADLSEDGGSFILLLEDMAPAEQGDQLTGCSAEVAALAVPELVGLHAPRWGDPTLRELPWLHQDPEVSKQGGLMMFPLLWQGFQERYDAQLTDEDVQCALQRNGFCRAAPVPEPAAPTDFHGGGDGGGGHHDAGRRDDRQPQRDHRRARQRHGTQPRRGDGRVGAQPDATGRCGCDQQRERERKCRAAHARRRPSIRLRRCAAPGPGPVSACQAASACTLSSGPRWSTAISVSLRRPARSRLTCTRA